jgi:hypothetical protein
MGRSLFSPSISSATHPQKPVDYSYFRRTVLEEGLGGFLWGIA